MNNRARLRTSDPAPRLARTAPGQLGSGQEVGAVLQDVADDDRPGVLVELLLRELVQGLVRPRGRQAVLVERLGRGRASGLVGALDDALPAGGDLAGLDAARDLGVVRLLHLARDAVVLRLLGELGREPLG